MFFVFCKYDSNLRDKPSKGLLAYRFFVSVKLVGVKKSPVYFLRHDGRLNEDSRVSSIVFFVSGRWRSLLPTWDKTTYWGSGLERKSMSL